MPKVSIIIPIYNVEMYIRETIDSVINQTLKDIEIILINDGSTDGSQKIIDEYSENYSNIVSIFQENSGVSTARNKGLSVARGEYIVFMDSDDLLPEKSIEIRYKLAQKYNAEIVIGGTIRFNKNSKEELKTHFLGEGYKDIKVDSSLLLTLGPCNKMYKADIVNSLKFPENIAYAEDQLFVMNCYLKAKSIYSTNEVVYHYRLREEDVEKSLTQQKFTNPIRILKFISEIWNEICISVDRNIENINISNNIKINYLDRLMQIDIWPPIKESIISKDVKFQYNALSILDDIINDLDKDVINKSERLKWVVFIGIAEHYRFLNSKNKVMYIRLLNSLISNINENSMYILRLKYSNLMKYIETSVKYNNTIFILLFLIQRKIKNKSKHLRNKVNNNLDKIAIKIAFNIGKFMNINEKKIVLATNKSNLLNDNLEFIFNKLNNYDKFDIKLYLNNNRKKRFDLVKMYFDFGSSKFIILDDYYRQLYGFKFKNKTEIIQIWHACGAFKRFGFSAIDYLDSNSEDFEYRAHSHYTKVITSSEEVDKHYSDAFRIDMEKVLSLGVPRTDIFFDKQYIEYIKLKLENAYPSLKRKKKILYAPTFRGNGKQRQKFDLELDFEKIIDELGEDYVIILKLHPSVKQNAIKIPEIYKSNVINLSDYKNINELLLLTDILITDYSSIVFEYSLLERPIIFFAYDLDSYLDERNFYYEYKEFVPGPIVYNNDEIINTIKNNQFDIDKINIFKDKFMYNCDGKSTDRLVNWMLNNKEKKE